MIRPDIRLAPEAPSPPFPAIPVELEFEIIDQLRGDKSSLASCTLVCRQWLHVSQHHLFGSITLDVYGAPTRLDDFLQLMDATPDLSSSIHEVTLLNSRSYHCSRCPVSAESFCALLRKVPRLRNLTLRFVCFDPQPLPKHPPEGSPPLSLERFKVHVCFFWDWRYFLHILTHFVDIQSFVLEGVNFKPEFFLIEEIQESLQALPLPPTRSLALNSRCNTLLALLVREMVMQSHSFAVDAVKQIRLQPFGLYLFLDFLLPCLGRGVQVLHLDMVMMNSPTNEELPQSLDGCLASCTALESLILRLPSNAYVNRRYDVVRCLRDVVRTYVRILTPPPPGLRTITFEMDINGFRAATVPTLFLAAEGDPWDVLDAALIALPGLERLAFVMYDVEDAPMPKEVADVRRALQGCMPRSTSRCGLDLQLFEGHGPGL